MDGTRLPLTRTVDAMAVAKALMGWSLTQKHGVREPMKRLNRYRAHACAVAAAMLLPLLAAAQQPPPPLPERVRTLDESLKQEQDDLLQRVAPEVRDQGRLVAALKAQQAAWLKYRDATCDLAGTFGDGGASAASARTLLCKAEWAEAQRIRLWTALDCIGQVAPADRAAELDRCLPALVFASRP
jgi:uncharacterized protein YecT (DUF1311 family)